MKQGKNMTTKRNYKITPLPVGHPHYDPTKPIYEVIIQEGNDYALLYHEFRPNENAAYLIENLEELSWTTLDRLTEFWEQAIW